ncbi:MAG: glycosyltransferase [Eggerthella sp.]|nr:glycosyltransferase [Eggerthella sp.]
MNVPEYPTVHHIPLQENAAPTQVLFAGDPQELDADIVVPVYNEEVELGSSIMILVEQLKVLENLPEPISAQVVIADNASSDRTWSLACSLTETFPGYVRAVRIPEKGRGRALKVAWLSSQAHALAYTDVDLSTDIMQIPDLIRPILNGTADISFGSRLMPQSNVRRCPKREFISRTYNRMLQTYLGVSFHDAQCGFKAISNEAARALLPLVKDNEWFFDTELLVLGERMNIAMNEFPVRWEEDPNSTVNIADTVRKDLAGMRRLREAVTAAPYVGSTSRVPLSEDDNATAPEGSPHNPHSRHQQKAVEG